MSCRIVTGEYKPQLFTLSAGSAASLHVESLSSRTVSVSLWLPRGSRHHVGGGAAIPPVDRMCEALTLPTVVREATGC